MLGSRHCVKFVKATVATQFYQKLILTGQKHSEPQNCVCYFLRKIFICRTNLFKSGKGRIKIYCKTWDTFLMAHRQVPVHLYSNRPLDITCDDQVTLCFSQHFFGETHKFWFYVSNRIWQFFCLLSPVRSCCQLTYEGKKGYPSVDWLILVFTLRELPGHRK